MKTLQSLIMAIIVGGMSILLFVIGFGVLVALFVFMLIAGLFVKAQTRNDWKTRWSQKWQSQSFRPQTSDRDTSHANVIEGECSVVEEKRTDMPQ